MNLCLVFFHLVSFSFLMIPLSFSLPSMYFSFLFSSVSFTELSIYISVEPTNQPTQGFILFIFIHKSTYCNWFNYYLLDTRCFTGRAGANFIGCCYVVVIRHHTMFSLRADEEVKILIVNRHRNTTEIIHGSTR